VIAVARQGDRSFGISETETGASRFLAATEVDMGRGVWRDPRGSGVTLQNYSQAWLAERTVRGRPLGVRTRETYRHSLDRWILPTLGGLPLDRIPQLPCGAGTYRSARPPVPQPRARRTQSCAILATGVTDGALARNPCRIAGAGQARSEERPLLDLDQVERLADAMPVHLRGPDRSPLLGSSTARELLAPRLDDVSVDAGTVTVRRQIVETDAGPREGRRRREPYG
jgi:hypothetical protein